MAAPRLYSTFLLWMLSELFERMPEVGDLAKPKLVFLFDEAHLLFNGAPAALLDQVERTTRLIRSKGVGVYYVRKARRTCPPRFGATRQPHPPCDAGLHAQGANAIRVAAQTMRANPELVLQEPAVGEQLVSVLNAKGEPSIVQRTLIRPPISRVGPLTVEGRQAQIGNDFAHRAKYGKRPRRRRASAFGKETHPSGSSKRRRAGSAASSWCRARRASATRWKSSPPLTTSTEDLLDVAPMPPRAGALCRRLNLGGLGV